MKLNEKKTIVILANSIRRNRRCIAGRELLSHNNNYRIGSWIRPITSYGEGEIDSSQIRLQDNTLPKIFDIVEFTVDSKECNECQPENYYIGKEPWKKISTFPLEKIDLLIEQPPNLWLDSRFKSDRISSTTLRQNLQIQSLYLVKINCFKLELYKEYNPWKKFTQNRRRIIFEYNNHHYNLPLTDPIFGEKYCLKIPNINKEKKVVNFENSYYFCLSLSAPLDGFHYKIVVTII